MAAPEGHIIVCGLGGVGRQIAQWLHERNAEVVALDSTPDSRAERLVQQLGIRLLVGDARSLAVLDEAGIATARAIVVATSDDLVNLEVALLADQADADIRIVVRLFNDSIARQIERQFPRWTVLSLADLAAPTLVAAAICPEVQRGWRVGNRLMALVEVTAPEDERIGELSELVPIYVRRGDETIFWPNVAASIRPGDRLGAVGEIGRLEQMAGTARHIGGGRAWLAHARRGLRLRLGSVAAFVGQIEPALLLAFALAMGFGLLSIAVFALFGGLSVSDALYFVVTVMTTTGFGDITLKDSPLALKLYGVLLMIVGSAVLMPTIYAFIALYIVSSRLRQVLGAVRTEYQEHIVVVGLGTVGFRVLEELRELSPRVIAIDRDEQAQLARVAQGLGAVVIHGDARQAETLQLANIATARAIVAVTSDDLANLETGLIAREVAPDVRVVLRLFARGLAERAAEAFNLGASFSPASLAAPTFAAAAQGRRVLDAFTCGERDLVVARLRFEDSDPWIGRSLLSASADLNARPIALVRGDETVLPPFSQDEALRAGDGLVLICEAADWHTRGDRRSESGSDRRGRRRTGSGWRSLRSPLRGARPVREPDRATGG